MRYSPLYRGDLVKAAESICDIRELEGKSILVTGATGLIGSGMADVLLQLNECRHLGMNVLLAGRDKVRVKERFEEYREGRDYQFVQYDAFEPIQIEENVDYFVHAAGIANTSEYAMHPSEVMQVILKGCENALEFSKTRGRIRLLFISSSEVYGVNNGGKPFKESDYGGMDIINPRSCYPIAKSAAETMCCAHFGQYGTNVVIARPGHIYGPTATETDQRASSRFPMDALENGVICMKSRGWQLRSYCYVIDCATALITILLKGNVAEAYNVANEKSTVTIRQMAEAFAAASGARVQMDMATEEEKKGYNLMDISALNNDKLKSLGWEGAFSMEKGASRTIECMKYQKMGD